MNFIRKIINSDDLEKIIPLPDELKHQNLEILVLPLNENKLSKKKSETQFNPDNFSGVLKINNIDERIKSLRNEWDRF